MLRNDTKLLSYHFASRSVQKAARSQLLIEAIGEEIDAVLEPVLSRAVIKRGRQGMFLRPSARASSGQQPRGAQPAAERSEGTPWSVWDEREAARKRSVPSRQQ